MKFAIIDDWSDALRTLPCFAKLDGLDVVVFNDHVDDPAARADQLAGFDAVILIRERSRITRRFLESLPNLKLISQFGKNPHIDIDACSDHGVLVCSGKPGNTVLSIELFVLLFFYGISTLMVI